VESLTNEVESAAWQHILKIDAMGGMIPAIEQGYPQREIAEASYRYQLAVDHQEKIVVGVNAFTGAEGPIETLQIDESISERRRERLRSLRAERSAQRVESSLTALRTAACGSDNLMPFIYDAVKAYATVGEICGALRDVFGSYQEVAVT